MKKALIIVFLILVIDQVLKIWIKTTYFMGETHPVFGHWFYIHFTENEGMAFGMKLGGNFGKLFLSLFRLVAISLIGIWLYRVTRTKHSFGIVFCISLILAGAIGNMIDSAVYGLIFNESTFMQVASIFPKGGGYAGFLHGKVVDMLYFPLVQSHFPSWFPIWGGEEFEFFRPVFNVADSSITVGVTLMIIFQRQLFRKP